MSAACCGVVGAPGGALPEIAAVARLVRGRLVGAVKEHFMAIGVNARHRVVMFEVVAVGSLAHVDVHPRELFRLAVATGVHSMVLAHNHPSGSPQPSEADLVLTRRMVEAGARGQAPMARQRLSIAVPLGQRAAPYVAALERLTAAERALQVASGVEHAAV